MRKNVFMCLAVTALWASCSLQEQYPASNGVPVELSGVINTGSTRTPINSDASKLPSEQLTLLRMFRADATSSTAYNAFAGGITGTFNTNGTIVMVPTQYYLNGGNSSKFIALYPAGTYNSSDGTFEYSIDGTTDIIASQAVEGSKGSPILTTMAFEHLLTQVKVSVKAGGSNAEEVAAKWGKVKSISIKDKKVTAKVTLPSPNGTAVVKASIAESGTKEDLPLHITHTGGTGGMPIPTTGTSVYYGYAMFVPPVVEGGLTLTLQTENYSLEKATNIMAFGAGQAYSIDINFTLTEIEISTKGDVKGATLEPWGELGENKKPMDIDGLGQPVLTE
jgi:hypothetical protein